MKKSFAIFIALLYIAITSGFTLDLHYCMGKLSAVKLQAHADEHCHKCGKNGKCCKDEIKFCKVDLSHEAVKAPVNTAPVVKNLSLPLIIFPVPPVALSSYFTAYDHHAPPGNEGVPLFIKHCTYRI